jgi:prepilin-type N-terminal cleavage/methylation domain-containing protein
MKHGRRWGFTLIELLVALAVIALLAALLFPTFAQAREKARQATCLSNLHQVGLAIRMYAQDWGDKLPRPIFDPTQPGRARMFLLQPYLHNQSVVRCPAGRTTYPEYRIHWPPVSRVTLRPRPGTVVALCMEHLEQFPNPAGGRTVSLTKGSYTIVREDASAAVLPAAKVELWNYRAGKWIRNDLVGPPDYLHFPGEPWPPEFGP